MKKKKTFYQRSGCFSDENVYGLILRMLGNCCRLLVFFESEFLSKYHRFNDQSVKRFGPRFVFSAVKFEFRSFQFYRHLQWVLFYTVT